MSEQMSGASPGLKSVMDNRRNLGARGQEGSMLWEGYPLLSGTRSDEAIVPHSQKINSNFLLQMECFVHFEWYWPYICTVVTRGSV